LTTLNAANVSNNVLPFESIERNLGVQGITFRPQKPVLEEVSPLENEGADVVLDRTIPGSPSTYQWFLNGAILAGETDATLSLSAVTFENEGNYTVQAQNPNVSGLTLETTPIILRVSSLERDSVALRELYIATDGPNWTNTTGWIDGPLVTWNGVTVTDNRVSAVDVGGRELTGTVPIEFLDAVNLTMINLSSNALDSIPSFEGLENLTALDVSNNLLEFDDLEANVAVGGFLFDGQQLADMITTDSVEMGLDFTVSVDIGGQNNTYQWSRNGTEIDGATQPSYLIEAIDRSNMGAYACEINNTTPALVSLDFTSAIDSVLAIADMTGFVRIAGTEDQFLEDGTVQLLQVTPTAYDTIRVNTLQPGGAYAFNRVILADYVIVTDPTDRDAFLPTYHEQSIQWDLATVVPLNRDTIDIDVNVEGDPGEFTPDDGNGLIGGEIFTDFPDDNGRLLARRRVQRVGCALRRRRGQGRTEEDEFELVGYTMTDDEGRFSFENLPVGLYRLFIEYPGIPINEDAFTEFEVGMDMDENGFTVSATVFEDGIAIDLVEETGVPYDYLEELSIYPNPVQDALFIRVNARQPFGIVFELLDLSGNTVISEEINSINLGNGIKRLDVSGISPGIYLIRVKVPEFDNQLIRTGKVIIGQ